jgi:hypothetical protein
VRPCRHEPLRGLLSAEGLSTGWAWCQDCGAIFRRSELLPPVVWDQDKPFSRVWMSDAEVSIWWTLPTRVGAEPGWSCEHAGSLALTGRHVEGLWWWCEMCGSVKCSLVIPRPRWAISVLEEYAYEDGVPRGVWHHPAFHGDSPQVRRVRTAFDLGPPLYGAPDA